MAEPLSTLAAQWVPVSSLSTADQITYAGTDFIVLEVLEQPIGGWVVIAHAVTGGDHPKRVALVFGNPVAVAQLSHRAVS